MSGHEEKPYVFPPEPIVPGAAGAFGGLQFMEAYQYVFRSPNWMTNVLLGGVCLLIPVVGQLVVMGYQFFVLEALLRSPQAVYPDFAFDRFVDYLKRGLWPFLAQLVLSVVVTIPLVIVFYVLLFVVGMVASAIGGSVGSAVMMLGSVVAFVFLVAASVAVAIVGLPIYLRAGLTQDFAEAFNVDFAKGFVRSVWKESAFAMLFLMFSAFVMTLLGMILCCVGMYPAMVIVMLAQVHLLGQLYQRYLSRGGKPIPIKPQP